MECAREGRKWRNGLEELKKRLLMANCFGMLINTKIYDEKGSDSIYGAIGMSVIIYAQRYSLHISNV